MYPALMWHANKENCILHTMRRNLLLSRSLKILSACLENSIVKHLGCRFNLSGMKKKLCAEE